jgi:hypothetical protein
MSKTNSDDIETVLEKWYQTKQEIAMLQKKQDSYKKYIERRMNKNGEDRIHSSNYHIIRELRSRSGISKKLVPPEVWNRYAQRTDYYTYSLKKA